MQAYATALLFAIPGFVLLILIEAIYDKWKDKKTVKAMDTISSLSSGITNVIKDSLGVVVIIISYPFLYTHLALIEIETSWMLYVVGFIAMDFAGYWSHRLNHSINIFWNNHVIHHSSEEFNLSCALRQSISTVFSFIAIFMIFSAWFFKNLPNRVRALIEADRIFSSFS